MTAEHWSSAQARSFALAAAGLLKSTAPKSVHEVLVQLGAVQLDTISVLARSHELVHHARVDGLSRHDIESALWSNPPHTFEYWSHAACVLPLEVYPYFAFRRRDFVRRGVRWHDVPSKKALDKITKRLAEGATTTTDLGGAKNGGMWWDWSDSKIGVEWLLDTGVAVCTERVGWRRVYRLATDVVPQEENSDWVDDNGVYGPSDSDCINELIMRSIRSLGIATLNDIADVHRLKSTTHDLARRIKLLIEQGKIIECEVEGWQQQAFRDPQATPSRASSRTVMLSPFDSLVWFRERLERIFGMNYRIEAYTPAPKRQFGYFAMPVLHGGELVARVDPGREGKGPHATMIAKTVTFEGKPTESSIVGTAQAIRNSSRWVNAHSIRVENVIPQSATKPLQKALDNL